MDLYGRNIMEHFKHPRNRGMIDNPSAHRHEANHSCGDSVDVYLKLSNDSINAIAHEGRGCAISQAALSLVSEYVQGKSVSQVLAMNERDVHKLLGVDITARRRKCALLSLLAIQNALRTAQGQHPASWTDLITE